MSGYSQGREIGKFQQFFKIRMKSNARISNFATGIHSPDLDYLRGTFTLHICPPRQVTTPSHIVFFF